MTLDVCARQTRPPGRGDFWILKIAHAPSPKNLSKNGFCPRKGVAFLRNALLQKKISGVGEHSAAALAFHDALPAGASARILPSSRDSSTGLVSKSSQPAASAFSLSPDIALAVRAMTGMRWVAGSALIRRVASSPSMLGRV